MRMRHAAVAAGLALGMLSGSAKAAYIVDFQQIGANVVATGSGSIQLGGLTYDGDSKTSPAFTQNGSFSLGTSLASISLYKGFFGPSMIGSGSAGFYATFGTGSSVGLVLGLNDLFVPTGYLSGSDLGVSTAVFENKTLSDFGLTAGSEYNFTFQGDAPESFDTFTVDVSGVSAVPLPASAPMFGAALLGLAGIGYAAKRKKAAAAA